MLAHCFNPSLHVTTYFSVRNDRGRVQSDWPVRMSIRIKRVLNIASIYSF